MTFQIKEYSAHNETRLLTYLPKQNRQNLFVKPASRKSPNKYSHFIIMSQYLFASYIRFKCKPQSVSVVAADLEIWASHRPSVKNVSDPASDKWLPSSLYRLGTDPILKPK